MKKAELLKRIEALEAQVAILMQERQVTQPMQPIISPTYISPPLTWPPSQPVTPWEPFQPWAALPTITCQNQ